MVDRPSSIRSAGLFAAAAVVAISVGAAIWGTASFLAAERNRDLLHLQTQFSIIVDGRRTAVDSWLAAKFQTLQRLADNEALQIYAMGLGRAAEPARDAPQAEYLRNLMIYVAQSEGFVDRRPLAQIPANVRRLGTSGLMIVSRSGRVLAASEGAPPLEGELAGWVAALGPSQALFGIYAAPSGDPVVAFAVPVFSVQSDRSASEIVGFVVGVKQAEGELFELLAQPGDPMTSGEILLLARDGETVSYISPRNDGAKALSRRLSLTTPDLDAAFALAHPGEFAEKRDYAGRRVLLTSRSLANAPWTLLYKADAAEALAAIEDRTRAFLITFALMAILAVLGTTLTWKLSTLRRTRQMAAAYKAVSERLEESRGFLRLLRDEDPSPTFAVSRSGIVNFANAALAKLASIPVDSLVGKTLDQVFGPAYAERFAKSIERAFAERQPVQAGYAFKAGDEERYLQARHIYIPAASGREDAVLVIENDITAVVNEREARRRNEARIVAFLMSVIDQAAPRARSHSVRVAEVSCWIGEALGLDLEVQDAIRHAALLVNVGKVLVPPAILEKPDALSDAERASLQAALTRTADLVDQVEFVGPVRDIVRQSRERWDGKGEPQGLAGEEIHIGARVVALANAFVAMLSERPYRPAMTIEGAFEILLGEAGKAYDRRVVVALIHLFESGAGRDRWGALTTQPT